MSELREPAGHVFVAERQSGRVFYGSGATATASTRSASGPPGSSRTDRPLVAHHAGGQPTAASPGRST